jgi:hypothetical protein
MADTTEQLKELNQNATLLLQKYDGVFTKLSEENQKVLLGIANKSKEGLDAIAELLESGNVAQAENSNTVNAKAFSVGCADGYKTVASGSWYKVPLDRLGFETENLFNVSFDSPSFTAPISGYYSLHLSITYNGTFESNHQQIAWGKNTEDKEFKTMYSSFDSEMDGTRLYKKHQLSILAYMEAGCEIYPRHYQDSGADRTLRQGMSYASGFLVGVKK